MLQLSQISILTADNGECGVRVFHLLLCMYLASILMCCLLSVSVHMHTTSSVGLEYDAAVSFKVIDPKLAVTMLCPSGQSEGQGEAATSQITFSASAMCEIIRRKAVLALAIIIGNGRLNNTFRATTRWVAYRSSVMQHVNAVYLGRELLGVLN